MLAGVKAYAIAMGLSNGALVVDCARAIAFRISTVESPF